MLHCDVTRDVWMTWSEQILRVGSGKVGGHKLVESPYVSRLVNTDTLVLRTVESDGSWQLLQKEGKEPWLEGCTRRGKGYCVTG